MRVILLLAVMVMLIFSAGCRIGKPIEEISANATTASTSLTEQDVRKTILTVCALHNWQATEISPGVIEAQLIVRNKHTIVVEIPYSAETYAIKFKRSNNMEYHVTSDGTSIIHPNYNKWVNNLNAQINAQLLHPDK